MSNQSNNGSSKASGKYLTSEEWNAMKAAGFTEEEMLADQPLGPVIFSYSRQQALEDGVLVDVEEIARLEGFKIHTVMTCGVMAELKGLHPEQTSEHLQRTVRMMLRTLRQAVNQPGGRDTDTVYFKFVTLDLWALCGPGDDGEAVLTVMLVGED